MVDMHLYGQAYHVMHAAPDDVNACAVANPALLLSLEQASPQDAHLASFMSYKPVTKVVIIIHKLLTSAFPSILHALQVSSEAANGYVQ